MHCDATCGPTSFNFTAAIEGCWQLWHFNISLVGSKASQFQYIFYIHCAMAANISLVSDCEMVVLGIDSIKAL